MSTVETIPDRTTHPAASAAPGAALLARVELRKAVDTRAGRWLLAVVGLLALAGVGLQAWSGGAGERSFGVMLETAQLPVQLLLPVVGVLLVTSEWSQRTALTTFVLVPRRRRVLVAKLAAATVLSLLAAVAALAAAAAGALAGAAVHGGRVDWSGSAGAVGLSALALALGTLVGVAFGLLLRSSALAIVLVLVLPTAFTVVTAIVSALQGPARWLDLTSATGPLVAGSVTPLQWAQLGTSTALWLLLPLALGAWRLLHRALP